MRKKIIALALCTVCISFFTNANAQTSKNKKSRYYKNNMKEPDGFNVQGFYREPDKNEVDQKPKEDEYNVRIRTNEDERKYRNEKRVIEKDEVKVRESKHRKRERIDENYYTTYGEYVPKREEVIYREGNRAPVPPMPNEEARYVKTPRKTKIIETKRLPDDREVKMTSNEMDYKTTYVKKRYTNLDVLSDDLDLAKIQRPVFKGICNECSRDVDLIITNKNLSSLEKNYNLKQCYMMRDKRIKETIDEDQYKKFLRIKDSDEYLVITKDLEQKDGVHK